MGHIHTEPGQHDFTSSAFIIRLDTPEPTLMLHEHRSLGKYLQFGGHTELDETPWHGIAHELSEESGYDLADLKILQPAKRLKKLTDAVLHPIPACVNTHVLYVGHYHTDLEYAFTAVGPPTREVDEGESRVFRTFTAAELAALSDEQTFANIREIGGFVFDVILKDWVEVDTDEFSLESKL